MDGAARLRLDLAISCGVSTATISPPLAPFRADVYHTIGFRNYIEVVFDDAGAAFVDDTVQD